MAVCEQKIVLIILTVQPKFLGQSQFHSFLPNEGGLLEFLESATIEKVFDGKTWPII